MIFCGSQSPDRNLIKNAFYLLKTKLKAERPTNKMAAVKTWQSITEENQHLAHFILICQIKFEPLKIGDCTETPHQLHFLLLYRAKLMEMVLIQL